MKMSDVKIGMRLCSYLPGALSPITVTEITERGFKYKLDTLKILTPHMTYCVDGHEHYGYEGETSYEPLPYEIEEAEAVIDKLCDDPEVWLTHGLPTESKLNRIKLAIAEAITKARSV